MDTPSRLASLNTPSDGAPEAAPHTRTYALHSPPPGDAVTLREAGPLVDRSVATLRGWLRTGALRGYLAEGADPLNAPVLVSVSELRVLSYSLSAKPGRRAPPPAGETPPPPVVEPSAPAPSSGADVAALRAELEAERARALRERVASAEARALAAERALEAQRLASAEVAHTLRARVADLESDRADLRDRLRALEAEATALRELAGLPWYRRLLGVRPSLPEGGQ
jgi:hypothetical protein